jgi:hypothetical protein
MDCTFIENEASWGGGISNRYSPSIATDCTFIRNEGDDGTGGGVGGGIHNYYSDSLVSECLFVDNLAHDDGGAGMTNWCSSPVVDKCDFVENSGGAMVNVLSSSPTVTSCRFLGNTTAGYDSGGISNYRSSSPMVVNCIFVGNVGSGSWNRGGGGMYNGSSTSPVVANCTFSGNYTPDLGGGMSNDSASATVVNCIFWGNVAGDGDVKEGESICGVAPVRYCNVEGSCGTGAGWDESCGVDAGGNIDSDPLFIRNPHDGGDGWWLADNNDYGNLRLRTGSPCIDAADSSYAPATDFLGTGRFDDPRALNTGVGSPDYADMGSYEVQGVFPDLNGDGSVNQTDLDIVLAMWGKRDADIIDSRADVNGDQFVGQTDLDYVLDGWGETVEYAGIASGDGSEGATTQTDKQEMFASPVIVRMAALLRPTSASAAVPARGRNRSIGLVNRTPRESIDQKVLFVLAAPDPGDNPVDSAASATLVAWARVMSTFPSSPRALGQSLIGNPSRLGDDLLDVLGSPALAALAAQ